MNPVHPWLDADEVKRLAEQLMRPAPPHAAQALQHAGFGREFVGFAGGEPSPTTPQDPLASESPPLALPQTPPQAPPIPQPIPSPAPQLPPAVGKPALTATPPLSKPLPQATPVPVPLAPISLAPTPEPKPTLTPAPQPEPAALEPPPGDPTPAPALHSTPSPHSSFLYRIRQYRDWMHTRFSATGLFILDREGAVIFDEGTQGRLHFLARSLALASRRPGTAATNVHVKIGVGATLEVIPVDSAFGCLVLGAVVPDTLSQEAVRQIQEGLIQTVRHPDNPAHAPVLSAPVPPSEPPAAPAHPPV